MNENINKTLKYIDEHINDNVPVQKLASISNLSPSRFVHLFKIETGLSPKKYMIKQKMYYARYLLRLKNISITELTFSLGFQSQSYFSNTFKKEFGIAPNLYKSKYLKEKQHENSKIEKDEIHIKNNNLMRRIAMVLNINEDVITPLSKYCTSQGIDLNTKIQEIIVKEQVKHSIDSNGKQYKAQNRNENDVQEKAEKIIKKMKINADIKIANFGDIYEQIILDTYKYYFGKINDDEIILASKKELSEKIRKQFIIENIEENQGYCWKYSYYKKVAFIQKEEMIIIF